MRTSIKSVLLGTATAGILLAISFATPSTAQTGASAIPTGISTSCSSFFNTLNSDSSIKNCTTPLLQATDYYTSANRSTSSQAAESRLQESLSELCATDAGCDTGLVRSYLSQFWSSCMTEIQQENKAVQNVYDVLYLLVPFREAICSKADDGTFCLLDTANSTTTPSEKRDLDLSDLPPPPSWMQRIKAHSKLIAKQAEERTDEEQHLPREMTLLPRQADDNDTDTSEAASAVDSLNGTNIAFLFLQPDSDKEVLCSTCAQNILAAYISFETALPYAIGLSNSQIFSGQSALYKAGQSICGDGWATTVNVIAGTTDFAKVAGAAMVKLSFTLLVLGIGSAALATLM